MLGALCIDTIPILDKNISSYCGITIYKNCIYLISQKYKLISVYDLCFNFIRYINLNNCYIDICYDCVEDCFWTISTTQKICKLEPLNMCEIDCKSVSEISNKITNISFNSKNNLLTLMATKSTYICNKDGVIIQKIESDNQEFNNSLCNANNSLIKISSYCECSIGIMKTLKSDFTTENITCLPKDYISKSCTYLTQNSKNIVLVLAYKKYNYPYIIKFEIVEN